MRNRFRFRFTAALTTASMLQFSLPHIVAAETSAEMAAAAGQANTSEFKPDPSLLYAPDAGGSVEILGVSPNGNLSFPPSTLYYGVTGQSGDAGALPNVTTYEDLYGYRDQQIGQLEAGTGSFGSTGSLNAESAAIEVLKRSANTPSVASQAFLTPSRDLLGNGSSSSEFGQCIIQQVVDTQTYTYDDTITQYCDTMAFDLTPLNASRTYSGPSELFTYSVVNGVKYCTKNGVSIRTDGPETCGKLSIFSVTPTSPTAYLEARACASSSTCVELVLVQKLPNPPHSIINDRISSSFVVDPRVTVTAARVRAENIGAIGYLSHQGMTVANPLSWNSIPDVLNTKGQTQIISVYGHMGITREPTTGYRYTADTSRIKIGHSAAVTKWAGNIVTLINSFGEYQGQSAQYATDGCMYQFKLERTEKNENQDHGATNSYYSVARICDGGPVMATAFLQVDFNPGGFGPWAYNQDRFSEIQAVASDGFCTLKYQTTATASNANGCVNSFISSSGQAGQLCGNDIPVAPFDGLPDRGSTRIVVTPICAMPTAQGGEETFTETDMCSAFRDDPKCTFVGRTCADQLANGTCLVWQNEYSCGQQISYSTPIVREINICNSNLSCLGDDCIVNTGTDGTIDLADAASKLAAADMLLTDMDCDIQATTANADEDMKSCQLFKGDEQRCQKVTLGIADCCKTAEGVSLADYLKLAFSVSRLARMMEGSALTNPITSAWVGLMDFAKDSFTSLARPLTETWESIIGNSGAASQGIGSLGIEAVKQTIMKNAAQWTANLFGEQAANMIFQVGGGPAISGGALNPGTIGLTGPASAIMSSVMMAYSIYTIVKLVLQIIFACNDGELDLMVRNALKSTHYVGTYCTDKVLGHCIRRKSSYCMFNSPLSRIMNEQARLQLGMSWGTAQAPNCDGITLEQFQNIDMEKIDLSEWTGMLMSTGMIDVPAMTDIEALTGEGSTLGKALDDLYTRENAIDRNINRLDGVDLDAARKDAVDDFGRGITE